MKKSIKLLSLALALILCLNSGITAMAIGWDGKMFDSDSLGNTSNDIANDSSGNFNSKYNGGKSTYKTGYDIVTSPDGKQEVQFWAQRASDGKIYRGDDAVAATKGFDVTVDIYQAMEAAGHDHDWTEQWMKDNGYYTDQYGRLMDAAGRIAWISFDTDPGTPEHEEEDEDGKTHTVPHRCGSQYQSIGTRWCLTSVSGGGNGSDSYEDEPGREHEVNTTETSVSVTPYSFGGSLEVMYESPGPGWNDNDQLPQNIALNINFMASWIQIEKYQFICPICGRVVSGPFYRQIGATSQLENLNYMANRLYPEFQYTYPKDLTTHGDYTGPLTQGFWGALTTGSLNMSIVDKGDFGAGETLKILDTLKPGKFTIDFGNSWFGLPGTANSSIMMDGESTYHGAEGNQFVNWATLYYGSKYDSMNDNPAVATMNTFNHDLTDEFSGIKMEHIDGPENTECFGTKEFFLRSVKNSERSHFNIGVSGINCWYVEFELCRNNLKGVDWEASATNNPGSLHASKTQENYTQYVIYNNLFNPVLYGEYIVETVAGMVE